VPVVKDAVFVSVNETTGVEDLHTKGLTKEAFIGIYITGEITTWGQAVAARGDRPDPRLYASDACGAAETWRNTWARNRKI